MKTVDTLIMVDFIIQIFTMAVFLVCVVVVSGKILRDQKGKETDNG